MSQFMPSRAYQPHLDIRFFGGQPPAWAEPLVEGRPPNSRCWLVIMPRRGGKTWLASAIATARAPGTTSRVDLRKRPSEIRKAGLHCLLTGKTAPNHHDDVLLVDEPGLGFDNRSTVDPEKFAVGLGLVHDAGTIPIVFGTPGEFSLLIKYLEPDASKDVLVPPVLDDLEISRMANRVSSWGSEVVERIRQTDRAWLQTPFLLELLLHLAEEHPHLRADRASLLRAAVDEAEARHEYLTQVFHNGLAADQRAELRATRWKVAGIEIARTSSVSPLHATSVPSDPVLADYLPEVLRIHHISDLHYGGEMRANVDSKDRTRAGRHIAKLAGAGTPLDSYLSHVDQLATRGKAPHLVILTGDVVNRPDERSGQQAIAWLGKLRGLLAGHRDLQPESPRILLVGGNHDVSWDMCLDSDSQARHRWFAEVFRDYPHPDLHLPPSNNRRLFIKYPDAGLRVVLLGSAESGGEPVRDEDHDRLETFLRDFVTTYDEDAVRNLIQNIERLDPGVLSRTMLDQISPETGYVTLVALHHPVSPVPSVEVTPYSGIVNAGQAKRVFSTARVALVLHGHTHLAFLATERLLGVSPSWTLRIAGAATLASVASDEQNGYNQIFISREGGEHNILVRPMRLDGGQWLEQRSVAFRPGVSDELHIGRLVDDPHIVRR
jgi:3',5'-cyclic AMP phosphodiesterase CpdA